MSVTVYL